MADREQSLLNSPRYRGFIPGRDRALDELHIKAQQQVTDVLRETLTKVLAYVDAYYSRMAGSNWDLVTVKMGIGELDQLIDGEFIIATMKIKDVINRLRRNAFTLAYTGETEAIARSIGQNLTNNLDQAKVKATEEIEMPSGGDVFGRIDLALSKIRREIMNIVQRSAINGEELADMKKKLVQKLPAIKSIKRPPKILKKPVQKEAAFQEADDDTKPKPIQPFNFAIDQVDEQEWEDLLNSYKSEFVPQWRDPTFEYRVTTPGTNEKDTIYGWELEEEITQDFVYQVRLGQIDAAKDQGIEEFVWIAVIDGKTDECCKWRDGLTTSEIEKQLKGPRSGDKCTAIVPPAHFNCRCTLAPITKDFPEKPPSGIGEFEEWLET